MTNPPPAPGAVLRPLTGSRFPRSRSHRSRALAPPRPAPPRSAPPPPVPAANPAHRGIPPAPAAPRCRPTNPSRTRPSSSSPTAASCGATSSRGEGAGAGCWAVPGLTAGLQEHGRPGDCPLDPLCMSCCPHLLPLPLIPPCLILEGDEGCCTDISAPPSHVFRSASPWTPWPSPPHLTSSS